MIYMKYENLLNPMKNIKGEGEELYYLIWDLFC